MPQFFKTQHNGYVRNSILSNYSYCFFSMEFVYCVKYVHFVYAWIMAYYM